MSRNYLDVRSRGFRARTHSKAFASNATEEEETVLLWCVRPSVRREDDIFHENEPSLANLAE